MQYRLKEGLLVIAGKTGKNDKVVKEYVGLVMLRGNAGVLGGREKAGN